MNKRSPKILTIIVVIFAFIIVCWGSIPVLIANWKNPLVVFGSIGMAPVIIGYVLYTLLRKKKSQYREKFFSQETEIGDTTFYSSKENPNIHASFTNKNPGNVEMNVKFTVNGEPLSEE